MNNSKVYHSRYAWLAPTQLWDQAESLIPKASVRPQGGGTARIDNESVFAAIVYVVVTGSSWRALPGVFGVSWQTAHRRFWQWADSGLWERLREAVAGLDCGDPHQAWADMLRMAAARPARKITT